MSRINCPLCDWHLDPEPPDVGAGMLADVFGIGVMQQIAFNDHLQKVERELQAHLSSHPLVEWVRKVADLTALAEGMTAEAAKARRDG
jgi:hypothetical protein